jgi:hypothetical protein
MQIIGLDKSLAKPMKWKSATLPIGLDWCEMVGEADSSGFVDYTSALFLTYLIAFHRKNAT